MKKIADLTKAEAEVFDLQGICKQACKAVIKEVVAEYESALLADRELWKRIITKYGISRGENDRLKIVEGVLYVMDIDDAMTDKRDEMAKFIDAKLGRLDDEE